MLVQSLPLPTVLPLPLQPRDPQLVSEPQFLHDVWMMQLAENADRLYLLRR